jgi:hypothetical protein
VWQSSLVDLREWIASDHASVANRFESAIASRVTTAHWRSSAVDGGDRDDDGGGPSIAWLVFHATYHQDLALNTAVRNHPPILAEFRDRLGLAEFAPSAGLTESEDRAVTDALDLDALLDYRSTVHDATAHWIDRLSVMALDSVPSSSYRLEHLAGIPADGDLSWLHAMWDGKPVSWFVQWECIGHGHAHVGEMVGVRNRLGFSPF